MNKRNRFPITLILLCLFLLPVCALAQNPEAQRHFRLGHKYYLSAKMDQAEIEFRQALELDPRLALAHYYLGSIYFKQDKFTEAKSECEAALEINPADLNSLIILGLALHRLGLDAEAVKVFQRAVEVDAQSPAAHSALGLAYCATGEFEQAKAQYGILRQFDADLAADLWERIEELRKEPTEAKK